MEFIMYTIRKLIYKPKKADVSLLAQFYYADEDLCLVAAELDSFDGRKNPERCANLVAQLRLFQDHVLRLIQAMMEEVEDVTRAPRDFRVKYPDDLLQDGLSGQLWFGAECLAAGSNIMNREVESDSMRPLARNLTRQLDALRHLLREQSLRDPLVYTEKIKHALNRFDKTFAEFELSYVSTMVPVKTMKEYDLTQDIAVLFSETLIRALVQNLITKDMLEMYDPALMFTIPRLAIVAGLVLFPEGPLNPEVKPGDMSEMFRPFQKLLKRIRELLWTLTQDELQQLEKALCNIADVHNTSVSTSTNKPLPSRKSRQRRTSRKNEPCSEVISSLQEGETNNHSHVTHSSSALTNTSLLPAANHDCDYGIATIHHTLLDTADEPILGSGHSSSDSVRLTDMTQYAMNLPGNSHAGRITIARSVSHDGHVAADGQRSYPGRCIERSCSLPTFSEGQLYACPEDVLGSKLEACNQEQIGSSSSCESFSDESDVKEIDQDHGQTSTVLSLDEIDNRVMWNHVNRSGELIHKLFVCISGVADQLQTNFASDLRRILKSVFDIHAGNMEEGVSWNGCNSRGVGPPEQRDFRSQRPAAQTALRSPPVWLEDAEVNNCCSCKLPFTFLRRRHHCRNCGLIFCSPCSSNVAPLPNLGYEKAVRICNNCYMYRVNPFYVEHSSTS